MRRGLSGRKIAVHVSGGVAVVKVPELITSLRRAGAEVRVAMTQSATAFISPTTLRALSGHPVAWRLFPAKGPGPDSEADQGHGMAHIDLAAWAECHLVVPATASTLARLATGLADDVVSATLLATSAPLILAPAMETGMWRHEATQRNLDTLVQRGAVVVGPVTGRLASGRQGEGRMAEPDEIMAATFQVLQAKGPLLGWQVLVTSGGTREPIDPVRYLGNRSSGKMGEQLAGEAAARGAQVHLVTAAESPTVLAGVETTRVETAEQMLEACLRVLPSARLVLMAAAVADFRAAEPALGKIHRLGQAELALRLVPGVDILERLLADRAPDCLIVAFAAETEDVVERGRAKLKRKGCDMVVANLVGGDRSAMGGDMAQATLLSRDGHTRDLGWSSKRAIAGAVLDEVQRLAQDPPSPARSA